MKTTLDVIIALLSSGGDFGLTILLAGIGSSIGLYKAGVAVFSIFQYQKQTEGKVDSSLAVFALFPSSQTLYGIGLSIFLALNKVPMFQSILIGLFAGGAIMISAICQGMICAHGINSMGKANEGKPQTLMIAGAIEFVALATMGISMVLALFLKG